MILFILFLFAAYVAPVIWLRPIDFGRVEKPVEAPKLQFQA
jgi:hypothetical protein